VYAADKLDDLDDRMQLSEMALGVMFTGTSEARSKVISALEGSLPLRITQIDLSRAKQIIPVVCWAGRTEHRTVLAGVESQR
jgi:hypothetical protein